jgi:hypothetical protein
VKDAWVGLWKYPLPLKGEIPDEGCQSEGCFYNHDYIKCLHLVVP